MRRVFLGWQQPTLIASVDWLFAEYQRSGQLDLNELVIVLPGARAGRRLRELLLQRCDADQMGIFPPQIVTMGHLPELLYRPQRPLADELVQRLAWGESVHRLNPHVRTDVLSALDPKHDDTGVDWSVLNWLEIGGLLRREYRELAADGLSFSEVARRGQRLPNFPDQARWNALADLQQGYLERLDALGIWDRQTARLVAVEQHECHTRQQLILVGMTDINRSLRQMLDQVSDQVTALIAAPAERADGFDRYGCVVPAAWEYIRLPLDDRQLAFVDRVRDQVEKVVEVMTNYDGAFAGGEITIGTPDQRLVPMLQRTLAEKQVALRWGPGRGISETGPYRLLEQVAHWIDTRGFTDFAQLARHPDLLKHLRRQGNDDSWLMALDEVYNQQLPARLAGHWCPPSARIDQRVTRAVAVIDEALGVLNSSAGRPLSDWAGGIMDLLLVVYGDAKLRPQEVGDRMILRACESLQAGLAQFKMVPESLSASVSASDAISILLSQVRSIRVPPPGDPDAVEVLGWLELALDDAPALIVTSFNEGFIPEPVRSEFFFPDSFRQELGLPDQTQRYARDAHALSVMLASRERMHVIVGKHDPDGDPLVPSRLLFATDEHHIGKRSARLFGDLRPPRTEQVARSKAARSQFEIPRPSKDQVITRLRVTDFRIYLECPYRFYLSRVLNLCDIDDEAEELNANSFGSLLHDVLGAFGTSSEAASTDPANIREVLNTELDRLAHQRFAVDPRAALKVQLAQMKLRLAVFSELQARWAADGWQITQVEEPNQVIQLEVDGEPIEIRGRIDRIDRHLETGRTVIWDYKSSDAGDKPESAHRRRNKQWKDLQLPLYRHLARGMDLPEDVGLGFINLPKEEANAGFHVAKWSPADLKQADEVALRVIRSIRKQKFWPPARPAPRFSDHLAYICQDGVMEPPHVPE